MGRAPLGRALTQAVTTLLRIDSHLRRAQVKTLVADPEMTTLKYYMETPEEEVAKTGQHFNDSVRDLFLDRIRRNRLGVFVNDIKVEPK